MATEAPPAAPDLTQTPRFDALLTWVHKLREWADAAVAKMLELETELEEAKQVATMQVAEAEAEAKTKVEEVAGSFRDLVEFVQDVERGVRKGPELFAFMRQHGWM